MAPSDDKSSKKLNDLVIDYVSKNPFATMWSIALIVGGLFGYIHYGNLNYIPEIDIKSAGTVLLSLSLTGILVTLAISFVFLFPAIYLRSFWHKPKISEVVYVSDGSQSFSNRKQVKNFILLITISSLFGAGSYFLLIFAFSGNWIETNFLITGFVGLSLMTIAILSFKKFTKKVSIKGSIKGSENNEKEKSGLQRITIFEFICAAVIWLMAFCASTTFVGIPIITSEKLEIIEKVFALIAFFTIIVVANIVLAVYGFSDENKISTPFVLFFAASPILFVAAMPHVNISVEKIAFRQLGLGNLPNAIFFVNSQACVTANYIRKNTCLLIEAQNSIADSKEYKRIGCILPHTLENRLGTEYLLAFNDAVAETDKSKPSAPDITMVPIAKKDVVQWAFLKSKADHHLSCPAPKKT